MTEDVEVRPGGMDVLTRDAGLEIAPGSGPRESETYSFGDGALD